ncbi:MAG TPA: hypothetical protein PLB02_06510 [Thermoanaerobaculia bacterium]|nr:hypothetical protein [Thermoanaerobaculia bacterium]HQR67027.1 hypothetical protein [Thermoanaerobaculia bacterium]
MTNVTVSASVVVPRAPEAVWASLTRGTGLPGAVLAARPSERIRFAHDGVKGWLPVGEVVGEYRLEPSADGVRLHLDVEAPLPEGELGEQIRRRLEGWVSGSLAARSRELGAPRRAA